MKQDLSNKSYHITFIIQNKYDDRGLFKKALYETLINFKKLCTCRGK